jgi:SpoIID/LytB domain protein
MVKKLKIKNLTLKFAVLLMVIILGLAQPIITIARTSEDIAREIAEQQQNLQKTQADLNNAQERLSQYSSSLAANLQGIPFLENEIKKIETEIEINNIELDLIRQNKHLKELERDQKEIKQNSSLKSSYMTWRLSNNTEGMDTLSFSDEFDFKRVEQYSDVVADAQQFELMTVTNEISDINKSIADYEEKLSQLAKNNEDLKNTKKQLEDQIAYYNSAIAGASGQIAGLQVSVRNIQSSISSLSEEQRQAILIEEEILRQNKGALGNAACDKDPNAAAGTIFFCGNGRDLAMGHGVGMSQFGAKGAADQGWGANQILEFYYQGSSVVQYGLSQEITVKYCPGNPALDPYQDGCDGGAAPVTERVSFDEYLSGLGEMPTNWPAEARKAQIIAARTYAARYTGNGNPDYPICLTTYCQVSYFRNYGHPSQSIEASLVSQTKDLVITHSGQLIEALYSADNNQGNGSSDSDTRFQNLDGSGSYIPYLRAVNDNQFAQNSRLYWSYYCGGDPCGLWRWKSYSYTFNDLNNFLDSSGLSGWKDHIGGVASLSFERDPSLRVKYVYLNGNNGNVVKMGGWWFKYHWNIWAENKGTYDYIYSQTFYLNVN